MMSIFDVNDWIRNTIGYKPSRNDFSEICKHANLLINKENISPEETEDRLSKIFGEPVPYLRMDTHKKPLSIIGDEIIPTNAVEQIQTALNIPVATCASLMPDAHLGYALPIGGVVGLRDAISPNFIGYDISCSVKLSILDIDPTEMDNEPFTEWLLEELDGETSFGLGADYSKFDHSQRKTHPVMDDDRWNIHPVKRYKQTGHDQLGSSGGGNHFADIVVGEITKDHHFFPEGYYRGDRFVALMTHSGSRGVGHKLATHYSKVAKNYTSEIAEGIPNGYEWLPMDSGAGQEYFNVMNLMGEYAKANHDLIHRDFTNRIEREILSTTYTRHNFAWQEDGLIVHRKGATPAFKNQLGIIPASMATPSRLVEGLGNSEYMNSSSHGAGRTSSRTDAFETFDETAHDSVVKSKGILTKGVKADESYQAYKDITDVMDFQEGTLVNSLAILEPKIVIMGG